MDLGVLSEAIDYLVGSDPSTCSDAESMEILQHQLARLDAFATRAAAAFDTSGLWAPDGARNAAAWLATRCRLPKGHARRLVRRGRELRHLPVCTEAWSDGTITGAHVDAISGLRRRCTEDVLVRDEAMLVDHACTLRYESFTRALAYWEQLADPDGVEEGDQERRGRRDVYLESSFGGMWLAR